MEHSSSKIKVYQSNDYKLFKVLDGNRPINKRKVENIIKEIKAGNDVLDEVPVLVKEVGKHLDVLDGQHRVIVAQKLGRPVHYIVHKTEMNLYAVAKVNSNTEKWKPIDFINCYKKAGNNNYKQLEEFHEKYNISIGVSLSLLTHGYKKRDGGDGALTKEFETGLFLVKKYKEAVQLAETCNSFSEFAGWNSRPFINAICRILQAEKCEFHLLIKKFAEDPKRLERHANWKGYLTNLENIYNVGYSKRRVIY
jgi:hypothetical protein